MARTIWIAFLQMVPTLATVVLTVRIGNRFWYELFFLMVRAGLRLSRQV